ncbi:MAG: DUF58 domain-containing protein [Methylovulum sp.]|nr:DUF58 domain-containing protein [Methylovulum sp.]
MLAKAFPDSVDPRVAVSLTSLIDLAGFAVRIKLHHPQFRARQSGGYVSRFKGRGMEFEEARIYQAGDDIRSIDWRVTARTGTTHTKIFREEREKPVFISVDNRAPMHFATRGVFKSVLAAKLAAVLAWTAQQQGDRIGGQLFAEQYCRELKPQNGRQSVLRFLDMLVNGNNVQAHTTTPAMALEHVLARLTHHARPGSLVYIISDFRGLTAQAEIYLAKLAEHCDVVLVFIYDALEKRLPSYKGHYRFTDQEREIIIDSADNQRLLAYQQHFADRQHRLEQLAKKRGLVLIECSTTEDPLTCLR